MTPALSVRGPVILGLAALVMLVAGVGLWATQTRLASAIVAGALVVVADNRQIVQHPEGGVVAALLVREGDSVAAGEPLLRLEDRALRSDLRILDERLTELAARRARLEAERDDAPSPAFPADLMEKAASSPDVALQIDGQRRLLAARRGTLAETRSQLARRIAQLRGQGDGITAQRLALMTELDLISDELTLRQALLDKGLATQGAVLALRREAASLTGRIGELAAALARTEDQMAEVEIQIATLLTRRQEEAASELRDIAPAILELSETRRALLDRIDRLTLRAPVSGVVLGLQLTADSVLKAAEPVLAIVPQDRPLVLSARIAPLQIDAVTLDQPAEVVLSAFPAAGTPRLHARVTRISPDALPDPETGAPAYHVNLALDPGETARLGGKPLLPGMPVEVHLLTGSRSPLAYLLEPFTAYFRLAMREG